MKELELYLHIPFCVRKCEYCDFLSAPATLSEQISYGENLIKEIKQRAAYHRDARVSSIFFGGGTPSLLPGELIARLMEALQQQFSLQPDAEITMECNPGTLTADKVRMMKAAGINRLSLGLQSADNGELRLLGRIHTWEDFLRSYDLASDAGVSIIFVELMSALPGQTAKSWERTLEAVTALEPEHISAYSLIIEEGTPFYHRYREDEERRDRGETPMLLPAEEEERAMYAMTEAFLAQRGYGRYEISNYARPGFACRHNIGYWIGTEYLGLGLGASSLIDHTRFHNTTSLSEYLANPGVRCEPQRLRRTEEMEEFLFLGLRLMAGVSIREFYRRFGVSLWSVYGEVLAELREQGLVLWEDDRLRLTAKGVDVSNAVFVRFLQDEE